LDNPRTIQLIYARLGRARRQRSAAFRFLVQGTLPSWMRALGVLTLGPLILAVGCTWPCLAWAQTQPVIRVTAGDHPYFGRVVLNAPGLSYAVNRDGDHVVILFSNDPILGELPPTPRNVLAIRAVPGGIELTVPLGANVRTTRFGDKVVVDIDDTVANRPPLAPLTDVQPPPRREAGNGPSGLHENGPNVTPDALSGQHSLPLPGPAMTRPGENASQPGGTPGNAQGASAALANAVLAKAAAGASAPGVAVQGTAVPANAAPGHATPGIVGGPGLPQIVAPGRQRGLGVQLPLATTPLATTQDGVVQKTGPETSTGPPAEVASTPAAEPGRAGSDSVSSVTFAPIAQDTSAMAQARDTAAPTVPPTRPLDAAQAQTAAQPATQPPQ
jgi:hypothetical protein